MRRPRAAAHVTEAFPPGGASLIDNPYVTRQLAFEFHYFFMRKFWFAYLAKASFGLPTSPRRWW